jgi:serine/threonine-protein kinase
VKLDTGKTSIGFPHLATPPLDAHSVFVEIDTWGAGFQSELWLADVVTGRASKLLDRAGRAKYLPTGHLAFTRGSTLMAAPFDLATRRLTGDVIDLEGGLRAPNSWAHATFGLASDGTLFFGSGGQQGGNRRLVIFDSSGSIAAEAAERREFDSSLFLSPKARRASVVIPNLKGTFETWVADFDRGGVLHKVCALPDADCGEAVWSPDANQLAFSRIRADDDDGIWIQPLTGAPARSLVKARHLKDPVLHPASWGPDGLILVRENPEEGDLLFLPLSPTTGAPGTLHDLRVTPHNDREARLSPDGRLLAFRSDESDRDEVYVAHFNRDGTIGRAVKVSKGAWGPLAWADSRRLFYGNAPDVVMMVTLQTTPELKASDPVLAYDLRKLGVAGGRGNQWDILPDGRLIGIVMGPGEDRIPSLSIVLNWLDMLPERLGATAGR